MLDFIFAIPIVGFFGVVAPIKVKCRFWKLYVLFALASLVGIFWAFWLSHFCDGNALTSGYYNCDPWVKEIFAIQEIGNFNILLQALYLVVGFPATMIAIAAELIERRYQRRPLQKWRRNQK